MAPRNAIYEWHLGEKPATDAAFVAAKHVVQIDAYVSPVVPESYVQTRLNLLSALREFEALDRDKIRVAIHETEPLSENAERAEQQFGITGRLIAAIDG